MNDSAVVKSLSNWALTALDETFEQVHGIYLDKGTSLFETLATISAEEASRPVSAHCASLAAQVEHVHFYLELVEKSMRGENPGKVDWSLIWKTVEAVTPEEWEASKQRLKATYQRIRTHFTALESWDKEDDIDDVLSSIVHTAYHLGEIRQALCTLK